ncbi:MAG TPA: methyltransferase domain-containing protein [Thermoanaerobaculaceae bacterium]|nr:methyltransferase domain-containing protein [Thermoanaerobaculaceae bacterium]
MATDYAALLANLLAFYEFGNKVMLSVGAGGGQLAGYGRVARKVIAVDSDAAALAALAERTRLLGIEDRFDLVEKDFMAVAERADVVLFEFALHEIPDPGAALAHAATLAPDTVIIDHAPGSPWSHAVDETEKVAASWEAAAARGPRRVQDYDAVQRFPSYRELFDKVKGQGEEAIRRIERWRGCTDITIPMAYRIAAL